jgi:hypothetical protein
MDDLNRKPAENRGRHPKPITKEMVIAAMAKTKSNKSAARYLNCSYQHYKKYAKLYVNPKTGVTLFDEHKNQCGKGIPKFLRDGTRETPLLDIIEGRVDSLPFNPDKIKYRLITEGYLEEKCNQCGFCERRVVDFKIPLILHFKDNDKRHYNLGNVQLLCYNCYFLYIGNVFTNREINHIEDFKENSNKVSEAANFELDEYHLSRLQELNIFAKPVSIETEINGFNIVSIRK